MKVLPLAALWPCSFGGAAPGVALQTVKPGTVMAISVDQLSSDLSGQYRQRFDGGLKRLSQGVVFPNGYQGHNATETCPGHSTILTGSRPARTGIIANNWHDAQPTREDKSVYCSKTRGWPAAAATITPSPLIICGAWALSRLYEACQSEEPGRGRRRQGPRCDRHGRLPSRPALVVGEQGAHPAPQARRAPAPSSE